MALYAVAVASPVQNRYEANNACSKGRTRKGSPYMTLVGAFQSVRPI